MCFSDLGLGERSLAVHFWLTMLLAALLGMMIHLLVTMDNPFRGDYCVSPDSFEMLYHQGKESGSPAADSDTHVSILAILPYHRDR